MKHFFFETEFTWLSGLQRNLLSKRALVPTIAITVSTLVRAGADFCPAASNHFGSATVLR